MTKSKYEEFGYTLGEKIGAWFFDKTRLGSWIINRLGERRYNKLMKKHNGDADAAIAEILAKYERSEEPKASDKAVRGPKEPKT